MGVSRFEGSLPSSRAKFCDSRDDAPAIDAGLRARRQNPRAPPIRPGRFFLSVRYLSPSKLPSSRPSVTACAATGVAIAFAREECQVLHGAGLEKAHRGGGQSAAVRRCRISRACPAPTSSTRCAASPGTKCSRVISSVLPVNSPAVGQTPEGAARGLIEFGDDAFDGLPALLLRLEHVTDQRLGFDFCRRPACPA